MAFCLVNGLQIAVVCPATEQTLSAFWTPGIFWPALFDVFESNKASKLNAPQGQYYDFIIFTVILQ